MSWTAENWKSLDTIVDVAIPIVAIIGLLVGIKNLPERLNSKVMADTIGVSRPQVEQISNKTTPSQQDII